MIKTIAVLLTCHNRRENTIRCLQSLFSCNLGEDSLIEVFLVDDGSTDGTGEAVKAEFPLVHVIQGNGNLYWNRGMHLAWETAAKSRNFDFYLWLNDDVELFPNSIQELLDTSDENDSIVVGTMRARNEIISTYGGRNLKGTLIVPNGIRQTCTTFNGNLVLVPARVHNQLGNLDPIFIHAIGDYDYALRAKKKGISSYVAANYCGMCEKHDSLVAWCLPEVPFRKRMKVLYTPLANSHPYYFFKFELRHFGLITAIKHFFSIHLRATYPQLWNRQS